MNLHTIIESEYNKIKERTNINESLKKINKISFYDFDGTLCDSPMPETHMELYKLKTKKDWPHVGWWGKPESINPNIFDIKSFDSVVSRLNIDNNNPNVMTVLLTARISKLDIEVKKLTDYLNIKVDDYNLKKDNKEKDQRILDYIQQYPDVKEIDVYDDREKEFILFIPLRNKLKEMGIHMNIYKCTKGKITRL